MNIYGPAKYSPKGVPACRGHFLQTATASYTTKAHRYSARVVALFARHFPRGSRVLAGCARAFAAEQTIRNPLRSNAHPAHPLLLAFKASRIMRLLYATNRCNGFNLKQNFAIYDLNE